MTYLRKNEGQNQKLRIPMNRQHTHNALTTQKFVATYFKDVKIEETRRQIFSDKKSPQRKSTPATIA